VFQVFRLLTIRVELAGHAAMGIGKWVTYLRQQYKRGWNEIPVVFCGGHFYVGALIAVPFVVHAREGRLDKNRYKHGYFIVRPDDPRLEGTLRFEDSPIATRYP